jgi:two-component system sensor histidine kinase KdpD
VIVTATIIRFATVSRRQTEVARLAEQYTATLHTLSRQLASTRGVDKLLNIAVEYLAKIFDSDVLALLPENNRLKIKNKQKNTEALSSKEQGVAQWVYDLGQSAGLGTDTLPFSDSIYVPLLTSRETIGVLRIKPHKSGKLLTPEQMHLLEACANQVAMSIEVDRLQEHTKKSELQKATDRVRNALLQSVSHDLRAPLVAVMGAASTLKEMGSELDARMIKKMGENIYFELEQLNRLINNLLQMTYLEAESVKLEREDCSLKDVVMLVLSTWNKKLENKPIHIVIDDDLPKVPLDRVLIEEVFINLIDNALKFTSPETPIDITAFVENDHVVVTVDDRGPGIVPDEENKLFEKFYRGRMLATDRGMGLGLAICRSIVKAHGGKIWAQNRADGVGASFRFSLPLRQLGEG